MTRLYRYTPAHRKRFVAFWNDTFADRPNYFPLTEEMWEKRVESQDNPLEPFDPNSLILAIEDREVCGFIHFGLRVETLAMVCYPDWPGGDQKYIACFAVHPESRHKGLGNKLWKRALRELGGDKGLVVDGQCFNPFYGNSTHPFTPFWGTTEGISVLWNDEVTRLFLEHRGYKSRFKAIELEFNLRQLPPIEIPPLPEGLQIAVHANMRPILDQPVQNALVTEGSLFNTVLLLEKDVVRGYVIGYMMREVSTDLAALYEMNLSEHMQGQGVGPRMLKEFYRCFKQQGARLIQTVTIPNFSPHALGFYTKHGFEPQHEWAIY